MSTFQHLERRRDELTKALTEYCSATMIEDLKVVTSITGINKGAATTFLAEMGSINKYASYKKLIAFAGIDPSVYQSSKYLLQGRNAYAISVIGGQNE